MGVLAVMRLVANKLMLSLISGLVTTWPSLPHTLQTFSSSLPPLVMPFSSVGPGVGVSVSGAKSLVLSTTHSHISDTKAGSRPHVSPSIFWQRPSWSNSEHGNGSDCRGTSDTTPKGLATIKPSPQILQTGKVPSDVGE